MTPNGRRVHALVLVGAAVLLGGCRFLGMYAAANTVPEEVPPVSDIASPPAPSPEYERYRETAERIVAAVRTDSRAHERLRVLCDEIGHRLSGSEGLERAVEWCADVMRQDGLDAVRTQKVMVPHWVRGQESAELLEPRYVPLPMLGLGNSVGTPQGLPDFRADVVVVSDFDDLAARVAADPDAVRGRIVLYDHPMPPYDEKKGSGYGATVQYRVNGPSRAAAHGAAAVLVRSVTASSLQTPHTGMLRYDPEQPKIPAAAITTEHAAMLARLQAAGHTPRVRLSMEAHFEPDAESANVIGEIRGRVLPDEVVVIGGHLDSWDVGHGAHDDGGACVAVMEAMRTIRRMGLEPRRTIRAVLFTNEENGLRGGIDYAEAHADEMGRHVAAIEADSGVFRPLGFSTPKPEGERGRRSRRRLEGMVRLLTSIGAGSLTDGGGGADIGPMAKYGVPQLGLRVEGRRYFDLHHSAADTFDKVERGELDLCVATLAVMAFAIADNPERLDAEPRPTPPDELPDPPDDEEAAGSSR